MRTYTFVGRIHPERYNYSILGLPVYTFTAGDGTTIKYEFQVRNSQLSVRVETDIEFQLLDLKNSVSSMACAALDSLGFVFSQALTLEIISCLYPDGQWCVFDTAFDGFREQGEGAREREQATLNLLIPHALSSSPVRMAISDLRRAISEPSDTVFHCYRAVESIRQEYAHQAEDEKSRAGSWDRLRQATGIPRSDLDWLKELAQQRRHGQPVDATHKMRERAISIAREAVYRHCTRRSLAPNVKVEIRPPN